MSTCVPWVLDSGCCSEWASYSPALKERATALAWSTLQSLSGGQVGNCPVTVRPCLGPPCDYCAVEWMNPMVIGGQWVNHVCGTPLCSCERLCEIVMPGPMASVLGVFIDGSGLEPDAYRVDNGNRLIRTDGGCWPSCQYLDRPLAEMGTMGVTYVPGIIPDEAGLWAAGVLACEFAAACSGSKCRLPSSVTSIARQGVAFTMSTGMFPDGMTGIREVDAYLSAINPYALRTPSRVWSPDLRATKHRYETAAFAAGDPSVGADEIHVGPTPPDDLTKLWVDTSEPSGS